MITFWIPIENPGKSGKNPDESLGAIFIVTFKKRMSRQLRRMTLIHLGLLTFRFHFGKTRQVIFFMIFGPGGRDHDSQNQLLWITLETQIYSK